MPWIFVRKRRKRRKNPTKNYVIHKEAARQLVHIKLAQWNTYYNFSYKRVAIRNTRRNWGSCTSLKNLNFNYKILFLPEHLQDYIVAHELCHLQELHHKETFWNLLAQAIPDYENRRVELRILEKQLSSL